MGAWWEEYQLTSCTHSMDDHPQLTSGSLLRATMVFESIEVEQRAISVKVQYSNVKTAHPSCLQDAGSPLKYRQRRI